jgi:hypothetical protein
MFARDLALSLADNRRLLRPPHPPEPHHQHEAHNTTPHTPHQRTLTPTFRTPAKMSGSAQGSADTKKAVVPDTKNGEQPLNADKKPAAQLEEDDEFEDFPVEGT